MLKKLLFMAMVVAFAAVSFGQPSLGLVYHEVQVVDEEGINVTDITSVDIYNAGTTTSSTIYKERGAVGAITLPMTSATANTTLSSGYFYWWGPAGYDFSITDGTNIHTNYGFRNRTPSEGRITFPSYLHAASTTTFASAVSITMGDSSDWVINAGTTTDLITFTPATDGAVFRVGLADGSKSADLQWYTAAGVGLLISESANTLAITGLTTSINTSSNYATSINAGSGTGDVHILDGTGTGAITIGSGASGAWAIDGTSTGTINADDSIAVTVSAGTIGIASTGGDITIDATDKSVIIRGTEAAADAIWIDADAGGLDLSAVDNIDMVLTAAASGDDFKITQAGSQDASIHLASAGTGADAISAITSAGGIDITVVGSAAGEDLDLTSNRAINLTSSEATDLAIVIATSNAAGQIVITSTDTTVDGIDINASGGIDIDTADDFTLDVAGASGEDILVTNTGGSIYLKATESAADATKIESTAGGIDIFASGAAAGEDIDIVATGSSVNITATEDDDGAIVLTASGPGRVQVTGGLDLNTYFSEFDTVPCLSLWGAGGASTGTAGDENVMIFPEGNVVYHIIGTQTITGPVLVATGLDITGDATTDDGYELSFGEPLVGGARTNFTVETDAFYIEANITLADADGADDLWVGFRLVEAYQADNEAYDTYAYFGVNAADLTTETELNGGGTTTTDINETNWADAGTHTLGVYVATTGAVTYELDGAAATGAAAFDWAGADVVVPFIYLRHHTNVSESTILNWVQIGLQ